MSMQIKTVASSNVNIFDEAVNRLLNEGWTLKERKLVQTPADTKDYCYAELVREDDALSDAAMEAFGRACDAIAKAAKRAAVSFEQAYEALNSQRQKQEPAPITWQQAVETIKSICGSREDCEACDNSNECPLYDYCANRRPIQWDPPCTWPEVPHD